MGKFPRWGNITAGDNLEPYGVTYRFAFTHVQLGRACSNVKNLTRKPFSQFQVAIDQ
jgi:hypothetical protein